MAAGRVIGPDRERAVQQRAPHTNTDTMNRAILIGNVGQEPEVRSLTSGQRVATLSLATTKRWRDGSGERQEQTQWHRLVVWGKLADVVEQYVHKGDRLAVEGEIQYRQWEDKEGQKRYTTEIVVRELEMLGRKSDAGNDRQARAADDAPARRRVEDDDDFPAALEDEDDDPF